jgi:pimeloyl-ACP methyl ester carboxylesterase
MLRQVVIVFLSLFVFSCSVLAEEVKDLETRPGVKLRFLYIKQENPAASLVFFVGEHGKLNLGSSGNPSWGSTNFLFRTRQMWANQGFNVAIVDAPSDRLSGDGYFGFRQSREHAQDLAALLAFLRQDVKVPVWLVGTSRGTTSAAFGAIALKENGPDGIVVTSSITNSGGNLPKMNLKKIKVPVLVVHNEDDQCKFTPYAEVSQIMAGLTNSRKAELMTFKGGHGIKGDPCDPISYHGYIGIEADVVARVSAWIKAQK